MKLHQLFESDHEDNTPAEAPPPEGDWITTAQAAKILDVSMSRVRQMIGNGELNAREPVPGRRDNLVKKSSVEKMKAEDRKPTGRPEGS